MKPNTLLLCTCTLALATTPSSGQCPPQETAHLLASDGGALDWFGVSVSLSGDTLVVGARGDSPMGSYSGSAYVFERDLGGSGAWGEVTKLVAADGAKSDLFGDAVALDGDTAVIGSSGADGVQLDEGSAYIFSRDAGGAGSWGAVQKLIASDAAASDRFGFSVAISGDTVVVSSPLDDDGGAASGSVYVFTRDQGGPGNWGEVTKLVAADAAASDGFGLAVAISAETVLVGASTDDNGFQSGSVYVFMRHQGGQDNWGQVKKLLPADGDAGDRFGAAVSISGDTAIAGAYYDDTNGQFSGSAYVFERDLGGVENWGELTKLLPLDGTTNGGQFAESVSISGDVLVAGARADAAHGVSTGSAYVFHRDQGGPNSWGEVTKVFPAVASSDARFGSSVSVSGNTIVGGAYQDDVLGTSSGSAFVFESESLVPVFTYCTAGSSARGCQALLSSTGTPSATAPSGFLLHAQSVEGDKQGIFFWGTAGKIATPFGTGGSFRCVAQPVVRGALVLGGGTSGACNGNFSYDLNASWTQKPQLNPGPGAVVNAQLWYRDPLNTGSETTSFSDGVEFVICQ